ncbi:MAG TPA: hypothetical protein VK427_09150 [Kofleriaceae bacterium]|nr:hypothetical protein [Kofleriaceae bacterium]
MLLAALLLAAPATAAVDVIDAQAEVTTCEAIPITHAVALSRGPVYQRLALVASFERLLSWRKYARTPVLA